DHGVSAFFSPRGLAFSLCVPSTAAPGAPVPGWGLHWGLTGARDVEPRPVSEQPGRVHSLVGPPSGWRTDQPTYGRIAYDAVLPGVDMVVESRRHGVEYALHLAAGSDPGLLRFRYEGAREIRTLDDGASLEI